MTPLSKSNYLTPTCSANAETYPFMLQAYVDGSQSFDKKPVFALGGYIADAETWAQFSDAWQAALDSSPRISCFKMRDALKPDGEFRWWSDALRRERIALLRSVIEEYIFAEFAIAFRVDRYQEAYREWGLKHQNPYFFASGAITAEVGRNIEKFGFERQPIEFIFDRQDMEMSKVMAGWEWATSIARPDPPDLLKIVGIPPQFQNDEYVLPLQAADMHAVWVRRTFDADASDHVPPEMPGFKRRIRGMVLHFNEQQLRERAALDLQRFREGKSQGRF